MSKSGMSDALTAGERAQLVPDLLARRFAGDSRSWWRIVWDDFRANRAALAALWLMSFLGLLAILAPLIANHRPYVLIDARGVRFPLFRDLGVTDWMLLVGLVQLVAAGVFYRRAASRGGIARVPSVAAMVGIAAAPLVLAAFTGRVDRAIGQHAWWWIAVGVAGSAGLLVVAAAAGTLWRNRRDAFGRLRTGRATVGLLAGCLLMLLSASLYGTLGRQKLDTTDYGSLASKEGVRAVFPPIPHEYTASEAYLANDPPGGPHARVIASGGSGAGADLGLTGERRHADLSVEAGGKLSADTPLADLRFGSGLRRHDGPMTDLVIASQGGEIFSVSLHGCRTIGDVLAAIEAATKGRVKARIGPDGRRLELQDGTPRRSVHLLGTDENGSDVAARLVRATRVALSIGFVSTGIAILIGSIVGALMGYLGGWVDIVGMRVIEIFMAIPRLFLLLTVIAFIPPRLNQYMLYAMMAVIGAFSWMNAARFIRAEFLRLRDQDFVQAAQAGGLPMRAILFRHMLPNGVTPVLVDASFGVAAAIFVETGLSFLGFGIKPPDPSWGQMLSRAVDPSTGVFHWWMAIFPGIMIFVTVFSFNLIGDALRDAIDPKLKKAA